jgi:hypothetical protein
VLLQENVGDSRLAQWSAELLSAFWAPQPGLSIATKIRLETGIPATLWFRDATPAMPAYAFGTAGPDSVIAVSGCSQLEHASRTMDAYAGDIGMSINSPENDYFIELADTILSDVAGKGILDRERLLLVGHSLGGCAVCIMLDKLTTQRIAPRSKCLTFGAPKLGNIYQISRLNPLPVRRWMMSDDPVPLLPPTTADTLTVLLRYSPRAVQRFARFVQPAGGVQITPQLVLSNAILPSDAATNFAASLAGWFLALDGSSQSAHHITSYAARIAHWNATNIVGTQTVVRGGGMEEPNPPAPREVTKAQQQTVATITALQERQNAGQVVIPTRAVVRAVRQGAVWAIIFGETTIAVTPNRRQAQGDARLLNEFLRRLQRTAMVDPSSLLSTMTEYLEAASDPAGGFLPVMNTVLPG